MFHTLEAVWLDYSNQRNVLNISRRAFFLRKIPVQQVVLFVRSASLFQPWSSGNQEYSYVLHYR